MTSKQLIAILKRFPKSAQIVVENLPATEVGAKVDQDGEWTLTIKGSTEIKTDK